MRVFIVLFIACMFPFLSFAQEGGITPIKYKNQLIWPGQLLLKLKPEEKEKFMDPAFRESFAHKYGVYSIEFLFQNHKKRERDVVDLGLFLKAQFSDSIDMDRLKGKLKHTGLFQYVEPKQVHKVCYTPNDPQLASQYHLGKINAYNAWNLSQGNAGVVIAIVDAGSDEDHQDLTANKHYHTPDPIDGIDNDGDGYLDNNVGWDFMDNDNNPDAGSASHGVHVAGCAAASTDNGIGVAAPGFNSKLMHLRTGDGTFIFYGYEAIAYAADHGADVINCSWGGPGGSNFQRDIITYASVDRSALIVAAAGNEGNTTEFFPAAYQRVLSVVNTDQNDKKNFSSTYGTWVDVCAPGTSILSTYPNDNYNASSGTSMASPIVAGAAALLKSYHPQLYGVQLGEALKAGCDNIDTENPGYIGLIGEGRINLYNSMLDPFSRPSVRVENMDISDHNDGVFVAGDTLRLDALLVNYLDTTGVLLGNLSAGGNPFVDIIDGSTTYGVIHTMDSVSNTADPFLVVIKNTMPQNMPVTFILNYSDGQYSESHLFVLTLNVDYINVLENRLGITITSKGRIGYNDYPDQNEGIGVVFPRDGNAVNMLFESGLLVGRNNLVSDVVRSQGSTVNEDFIPIENIHKTVAAWAPFEAKASFNDDGAGIGKHEIDVHQKIYAWNDSGHKNYVISEYTIINESTADLSALYAGIFCDWDIGTFSSNKSSSNSSKRLGYVYETSSLGYYGGVQVVSDNAPFIHYAVDHISGGAGGIDLSDGFSENEKMLAISTNRLQAGQGSVGNDVFSVVSTGPFFIAQGDSFTVAFAFMGGQNLAEIESTADSAWARYNKGGVALNVNSRDVSSADYFKVYPNPTTGYLNINARGKSKLMLYNSMGEAVFYKNIDAGFNGLDMGGFSSGIYTLVLTNTDGRFVRRVICSAKH